MNKPTLAQDLMRRPVHQLTDDTPVRDAAAFLLRHGISGAPVIDAHGRWIGVFSLNDLARSVEQRIAVRRPRRTLESRESVVDVFSLPPEELRRTAVKEFMTRGLFTVFPDATLEEVARTMTAFRIHRVFVIDEKSGALRGVITTMDLLCRLDGKSGKNTKTRRAVPAGSSR